MPDIAARIAAVEARMDAALARCGRSRASLTLVAVSKTRTVAEIAEAHAAGLRDFGENRVQEAAAKASAGLPPDIVLHLVGHLQQNKARDAVRLFRMIHSVDSVELLQRLDRLAPGPLEALVEVNVAGEASKQGIRPAALPALLGAARALVRVSVVGLMCIPPAVEEPERARPWFRALRELRDAEGGPDALPRLSMGMSHDFEIAIEEGATLIRVGEAIFGPRHAP